MKVLYSIKNRLVDAGFRKFGIPKVRAENISKAYIKKFLPPRPVIIDCGAYDGKDSVELHQVLNAQVHAFEPVPEVFERLKLRTRNYSSIHCYNLALSNITGKQDFFVSEGGSDGSSSLLAPDEHLNDHPTTFFKKIIQTESLTLDEWATVNGIKKVDMLWLDMQGFEMDMLSASEVVLPGVKAIHTEVSVKNTYHGVKTYDVFKNWLLQKGFGVELEAIPSGWDMGNVLFVKK
jgi:FkbM family methyltransferase